MKKSALFLCLFGLFAALPLAPAHAQATRTFVSGTGNDGNPCSRTSPCQTFAAALALTAPGGEINVLDAGGYGSVTITKSVSIYNDGAGEAGIVVAGVNAIVINAGATDSVNLRGLTLNGLAGSLGVHILQAGHVTIQNCVIQQFGTGVNVATSNPMSIKIQDSTIINNTNAVSIVPGAQFVNASIDRTRMDTNSGIGVQASGAFGGSVLLGITDSSTSLNGTNGVLARSGSAGSSVVTIRRHSFVGNGQNGVLADKTAGNGSVLAAVGDSMFAHNIVGAAGTTGAGASMLSFGTNTIIGTPGTGFTGMVAQQ